MNNHEAASPDQIIAKIVQIADSGNYLYRGEDTNSEQPIKSTLYREYESETAPAILDTFSIDDLQAAEVATARHYGNIGTNSEHILFLLQHHRGKTNLIDFTQDYLIALFFACDSQPGQPGRFIFLDRDAFTTQIRTPYEPANRVIAQKSVFVQPLNGFIPLDRVLVEPIPATAKPGIIAALQRHHGISATYIYNDLHGYVARRDLTKQTFQTVAKALELQKSGHYDSAIATLTNATTDQPENAVPYVYRAMAYYHLGRLTEAINDCNTALTLNPEMAEAYNNRGLAHLQNGDRVLAKSDYDRAIEINPQCAHAFNNRGILLYSDQRFHEASADFELAIQHEPSLAIAYFNNARAHIRLEDHGRGSDYIIEQFYRAVTREPSLIPSLEQLAKQLVAAGHPAAAEINEMAASVRSRN